MGMVTDTVATAFSPDYWASLSNVLLFGTKEELYNWVSRAAMNDYDRVKKSLEEQFKSLKDEAFRLKNADKKMRKEIEEWTRAKSEETWGWVKTIPEEASKWFSNTLLGSMIMSTRKMRSYTKTTRKPT